MDVQIGLHDKITAILNTVGMSGQPDDEVNRLVELATAELELRVGRRLSSGMSDEQLQEFEDLFDAGDEAGCGQFLKSNAPDTPQIVEECLGSVLADVETRLGAVFGLGVR